MIFDFSIYVYRDPEAQTQKFMMVSHDHFIENAMMTGSKRLRVGTFNPILVAHMLISEGSI